MSRRRKVAILGAAVALTLCTGVAGYVWIADFPLVDAVYMAIMTMTTVGYGEIHPLGRAGRIFNSFYMVMSVSAMLTVLGVMTQAIFEAELRDVFGRRRARKMIEKLRGHFIVCGFGRVGRGAAAELRKSGADVVVVDRDEKRLEWAQRQGCATVAGDATTDDALREAGIERAAGLVAALSTDADNLFVDTAKNRLFVGMFELDAKTGNPTGRRLARGQQILALDATANAYWAIGVENIGGKATNVVVTLDRESLAARATKTLNAVSGVGESFALDLARKRLYVGKMTTAEIEMWILR
jgi:voltage-gated potassium channel